MFPEDRVNYLDFDIYSRRISFYYKNKEKIGTVFGFLLTVFYAIISLILFLIYFIKTMKREEVSASHSTIYPTEIPSIHINNDLFYLAFALEHPTKLNKYIDEKIYYPEVLYIERIKKNGEFVNKSETILEFEKCNITKFGDYYRDIFDKNELNDSYCIKDINLTLKGGFKYNELSYIRINIYPCVNNTQNNNHCRPQDIIDKYLSSTYFSVQVKDVGFNPFNYTFPIVPIIQDLYTTIDKSIYKEYIMYVGIAEIDTDRGLFSTNIKREKHVKYIRDYHSYFFTDEEYYHSGKKIFTAHIRLEDNIYYLKRKYTKMSEVFSTTGGYMQVISTIFTLIALVVKKINIEEKLLNSLFNFNIKQKKIILCIEYGKKLDYNLSLKRENTHSFIPYEARKSLITGRNKRRNSIFHLNINNNNFSPIMSRKGSENDVNNNNINNNNKNKISEENLIEIVKNISKGKEQNNDLLNQSINKSKNILIKDDNFSLNDYQMNRIINMNKNKKKKDNSKMRLSNIMDLKKFDEGRRSMVTFNLFDYYCLRRISKKKVEIDLFNFGINFYKSQMDIINFFNIMILTQIMLTNSKKNILSQTIELSMK